MLTLLIDTSTERGIVALLKNLTVLFHEELPVGYSGSQFLLPTIERGLEQTRLKLNQLNLIAVGVGPGSYTGMRIGAMVAKSFTYACQLPLTGVCSLKGFVPQEDGPFAVLVDAKLSGVYLLTGKKIGNEIEYTSEPSICSIAELGTHLTSLHTLITPNAIRLKPLIQSHYPKQQWKWMELAPNPIQMALISNHQMQQGHFSRDGTLELLYLRKTQAEIEKQRTL